MNDTCATLEHILDLSPEGALDEARRSAAARIERARRSLVLFGAGRMGRRTLAGLREYGLEPFAFIDNNSKLWGTTVEGVPVRAPSETAAEFGDSAVFVPTTVGPVCRQLERYGVRPLSYASLAAVVPALFPHYYIDRPQAVLDQRSEVENALGIWADDRSRQEYLAQIHWRLVPDTCPLPPYGAAQEIYFPADLFTLHDHETAVDCGAYDGDSLQEFLQRCSGSFHRYIAIEPDPNNCTRLRQAIGRLAPRAQKKITIEQYAVGSRSEDVTFDASGTAGSAVGQGSLVVPCRPLDQLLEPGCRPTHIKMDIEGSEYDALVGAEQTLRRDRPILAICLYHRPDDLWRIPLYLHALQVGYRLYLRRYSDYGWEQVCYAVPEERP
jgi:FkbM family methyltransferase